MAFRFRLDENGHPVQIPTLGAARTVNIAATSTQSAALTADAVRLQPTVTCFVIIGANPTATTSGHYLLAGQQYDIDVQQGDKIATIRSVGDGVLYISELS
jgi:hypothetical protein